MPQLSILTEQAMNNQNNTHVFVVGMGMAGLMAAYTAAQKGKKVTLLGTGMGALSIASGCIDVLGYTRDTASGKMHAVENPFTAISALPTEHPYSLIGQEAVEHAFTAVQELLDTQEGTFLQYEQKNTLVPTIIGTLKPTYIYPASSDAAPLFTAKRVLIASVDAIRDCHPHLMATQLKKYPALKHVDFSTASLTSHFGTAHRAISPLDVARYVDTPEGFAWLENALQPLAHDVDAILLPPILGTSIKAQTSAWKKLQERLACPVVETLSLPPGVGGNRIYALFMRALQRLGVRIIENATITGADIQDGRCSALFSQGEGVQHRYEADAFILATGGLLGGGITTTPGKAFETILGLHIDAPLEPEQWAGDDAFGSHAFTQMGVKVNAKLQPVDHNDTVLVHNVYFAGRTLSSYDFATEKSGNGVALATGWYAAHNI